MRRPTSSSNQQQRTTTQKEKKKEKKGKKHGQNMEKTTTTQQQRRLPYSFGFPQQCPFQHASLYTTWNKVIPAQPSAIWQTGQIDYGCCFRLPYSSSTSAT
jgi:hypothetical protein